MNHYVNPAGEVLAETINSLEALETKAYADGENEYGAGIQLALIWIKHAKETIRKKMKTIPKGRKRKNEFIFAGTR